MDEPAPSRSREERLAAKLRENLKRRKTQSRVLEQMGELSPDQSAKQPDIAALPKGEASR